MGATTRVMTAAITTVAADLPVVDTTVTADMFLAGTTVATGMPVVAATTVATGIPIAATATVVANTFVAAGMLGADDMLVSATAVATDMPVAVDMLVSATAVATDIPVAADMLVSASAVATDMPIAADMLVSASAVATDMPIAATVPATTADISMDDIPMNDSPPLSRHDLQGASRTTGGIFRNRAHGNNPNMADFVDQDDSLIPVIGKIYLYITGNDPATFDFTTMKRLVIKHNVTSSLARILTEIGDRHSPVRSK